MLLPIAALLPEVLRFTPDLNDGAFHLGVARATVEQLRRGGNPIDFWIPTWVSGFPLFHHYQPAPYLLLALLHAIGGGGLALETLYRSLTLAALALFPVTNWIALRWLGRSRAVAAAAAAMAFLVSADRRYGIELESFTWYGWGLFTQAVALPLLPVATAAGFRAIEGRGRMLRLAALLAATTLCHVLYGYVAALSAALVLASSRSLGELGARARRAVPFFAEVAALLAFFVVPLLRDRAYHATSLYDPSTKFDSWGSTVVIGWLLGGDLLDHGRLPILSAIVAIGFYAAVRDGWVGGDRVASWIATSFVFWTLLYFGRPTWGGLVDWLPMSRGLHLERLSSAVHLFALWLAALGLAEVVALARDAQTPSVLRVAVAVALAVGLLSAATERTRYVVRSTGGMAAANEKWVQEAPVLRPILDYLRGHPGRVHAGGKGNWGQSTTAGDVPLYQVLSAEGLAQIAHAPFSWALSTDFQVQVVVPDAQSASLYDIDYLLADDRIAPTPGAALAVESGRYRLWRLPNDGPFSIVRVPVAIAGDFNAIWSMIQSWDKGLWSRRGNHARLLLAGESPGERPVLRMTDPLHFASEAEPGDRSVFDPPGVFMSEPDPPPAGRLSAARVDGGEAEVTVEAPADATVLFRTTFHPGWRATVDGAPAATMALTPGLIGVDVPAGTHRLRLDYRAGVLEWILLLLGVTLAWLLDRSLGDRHRAPGPPPMAG
ncbi:MAG: hypothetical protein RL698_1786 [Pseudomonadota bacterium]|jgi:hypothetical protein